jgi:hypothetical protein
MKPTIRILLLAGACGAVFGCSDTTETPTTTTVPSTEFTVSSSFTKSGSASRTFVNTAAGDVNLTLTSASPAVALGIGVGIPRSNGAGCEVSSYVVTSSSPSPQLIASAEAGTFCVKVFDVGNVVETVTFSLFVKHS